MLALEMKKKLLTKVPTISKKRSKKNRGALETLGAINGKDIIIDSNDEINK